MKVVILFALAVLSLTIAKADDDGSDCKCWEDFEPEKDVGGWYCRGKKNHRIFSCGAEKPPLCNCKENGKPIVLDLGETSCASIDKQFDSLDCGPKEEWELHYSKHPEHRIYYSNK